MRGNDGAEPRTVMVAAERFGQEQSLPVGAVALCGSARKRASDASVAPDGGDDAYFAGGWNDEDDGCIGFRRFDKRCCGFARQQVARAPTLDKPPDHRVIRFGG
jgi:hypothetical protein